MKKKLPIILIILICFCSLTVFSSCDFILDMIFGPNNPAGPGNNEPPAHVHTMEQQTYEGNTCVGQTQIDYYKCSECGKCYLDGQGAEEIADVSVLEQGHLYVVKYTATEHYSECNLCHTEKDDSRSGHASNHWWYSPSEHYKLCDVCGVTFNKDNHDSGGSCQVCGRKADYQTICNSRYGYEQLAALKDSNANVDGMQKFYNKIDKAVKSAHDNASLNATYREIGEDAQTHETVMGYALQAIDASDCYITDNEAKITVASYTYDNPLYYWISKQCGVGVGVNKKVANVSICVCDEYAEGAKRVEQNVKLYAEIDRYLSAISDEQDNYSITLSLHDAIIDNIDYAEKADGSAEDASWAHSILGVFQYKYAVCEGYAKAFQLLLNAGNVDNIYVVGRSKNEGHAWNLVKMSDDQWYWYDLTWDDQPTEERGIIYKYFCKPDSAFTRDHTVSQVRQGLDYFYDLPRAATTDYDGAGLQIDKEMTVNGITYTLVGYNCLSVTKILSVGENGIVAIPSAVINKGIRYAVKQIGEEALITYDYNDKDEIISKTGPSIVKLIIPSSVDLIYCKSFRDSSELISVEFEDSANWLRYALTDKTPVYQRISADNLSNDTIACKLLKDSYKHAWVKESVL